MTSTTDTDGHPEVSEISALAEGVLSPARSADLREHLADCTVCDDVRASLDEIRELLGTLPGPARMPEDVAGRINAALAAEALLDATAPQEAVATVSRETATTVITGPVSRETSFDPAHDMDRLVSRETPAGERPAGRPRGAVGPGRPSPARSRRWRRTLLGTACAAAAIGVSTFLLQGSGDDGGDRATPQADATAVAVAELKTRVHDALSNLKPAETRGMRAQDGTETYQGSSNGTAPYCVSQGIGRADRALAVRQERFTGTDTYLVIYPHSRDAALVDVYVVAADCVVTSSGAPGKVLARETVSRS
ncbi:MULTISPECIES: anti-sigma factor [Streptomyces]|uniref:zf-HC2 domain-containing protein n=1 Tax=Streptomyces TaxID=1883 RepID=UPI00163C311C|nr:MULTISPECIES: zf-HC2 domain-containing protein [Streptomyces]MBC2873704.1 zf-HC2 domain-containing protein [Streptomyces sp. TYQ1024]UBI37868.1 zf-HC2 domain-containing protein [Streptomyces mobaraensis]UKW30456.1 zf-HC2 domain-containing protein [Streptomyces sp. TYQ1024]